MNNKQTSEPSTSQTTPVTNEWTPLKDWKLFDTLARRWYSPVVDFTWIKKLDPSPLWTTACDSVQAQYITCGGAWNMLKGIVNVGKFYQKLRTEKKLDMVGDFMMQQGAVVIMYLSNPTMLNTGMFFIYVTCQLGISVTQAIRGLIALGIEAANSASHALKQLLDKVWDCLKKAYDVSMGKAVADEEDELTATSFSEGVSDMAQAILALVGAAISATTETATGMISKTLQEGTKSLNGMSKTVRSTEHLVVKVKEYINLLVGCVFPDAELQRLMEELATKDFSSEGKPITSTDFLLKIEAIGSVEGVKEMKKDLKALKDAKDLLGQARMIIFTLTPASKMVFTVFVKRLEEAVHTASKQATIPLRKFEPFFFLMYGDPGVGKSVTNNLLWEMLKKKLMTHVEINLPISEDLMSFPLTTGINFISGYKQQFMVSVDDLNKESQMTEGSVSGLLINMVSPNGLNLPGAGVEEKVNEFNSKLIMATTNVPFPDGNSTNLKKPSAYYRRRNLLIEAVKETGDYKDPHLERGVTFYRRNPVDPAIPRGSPLTLVDVFNLLYKSFLEHWNHEMTLVDISAKADDILACMNHTGEPVSVHDCVSGLRNLPVSTHSRNRMNQDLMVETSLIATCRRRSMDNEELEDVNALIGFEEDEVDHFQWPEDHVQMDEPLVMEEPWQAPEEEPWEEPEDLWEGENPPAFNWEQVSQEETDEFGLEMDWDPVLMENFHADVLTYTRWEYGRATRHGIMDTYNPRAVIAACRMMRPRGPIQLSPTVTIVLPTLPESVAMWCYRRYGLDVERAIEWLDAHEVDYVIQPHWVQQVNHYEIGGEPMGEDLLYGWGGTSHFGDDLFLEERFWISSRHNSYEDVSLETSSSYGWGSSLDEEDDLEATALTDGEKLRLKLISRFGKLSTWAIAIGLSSVVAIAVIACRFYKPKLTATYGATGIGNVPNSVHEVFTPAANKHGRNVVLIQLEGGMGTGFLIDGHVMLAPYHLFSKALINQTMHITFSPSAAVYTEKFDPANITRLTGHTDAVLYTLTNSNIPLAPKAREKFVTSVTQKQYDVVVVGHCGMKMNTVARMIPAFTYTGDGGKEKYTVPAGLQVDRAIGKGFSGSIVIDRHTNRILGMQVAGSNLRTIFEIITQDRIPVTEEDVLDANSGFMPKVSQAPKNITSQSRTSIVPSVISSFVLAMYSTIMAPAPLWGNDPRIKEPCDDLLKKSMDGYDHAFASIDQAYGRQIVRELVQEDAITRKPLEKPRLLNISEMINGNSDLHVKHFETSTSPGLPWKHQMDGNARGKRNYILGDLPNRTITPDLQRAIDNFDFDSDVLGYACLKDELVKPKKVIEGKTRSFIVLPMEYNLILRKYFGMYIGEQHRRAGQIASCVGVNPYTDWERIYARLASCSTEWEDFDYTEWDRTLSPDWFMLYADRVSGWYDDGPENAAIRTKLMKQLAYAHVQIGSDIFATQGGNKSGCSITAEVNTDIHEMLMLYCWFKLAKENQPALASLYEFRKHNEFVFYGDDQVKATKDVTWFNGNNIKPLMTELGMKITPADKEETVFSLKEPSQVSFLKRKFGKRVGTGLMFCPLDKQSIFKSLHFVKKSGNLEESTMTNVNNALREMFYHGKEEYERFMNDISKACRDAEMSVSPELKDWEVLESEWMEGKMAQLKFY